MKGAFRRILKGSETAGERERARETEQGGVEGNGEGGKKSKGGSCGCVSVCVHLCVCACVCVCVSVRQVLIDKVTLGSARGASGRSIRQAGSLETEALPPPSRSERSLINA